MKHLIALIGLLVPSLGLTCSLGSMRECRQQVLALLSFRVEAIQTAFGDMSVALPEELQVRFVSSTDAEYQWVRHSIYYDPERQLLLMPRSILRANVPKPLRAAAYYWPFYLDAEVRSTFPVVEDLDNAIWGAFLQEAARRSGQTWPHSNCHATDINKRLPCRMLLSAAARLVKMQRDPFFNENRMDRIWPDDMASFGRNNYGLEHSAYADVVRLGGFLLLRSLIAEFGIPRVLAYVAQNPLIIDDNNLRTSALRYQDRARSMLATPLVGAAPQSDQLILSACRHRRSASCQ